MQQTQRVAAPGRQRRALLSSSALAALLLAACGGGGDSAQDSDISAVTEDPATPQSLADTTVRQAQRMAEHASFGPSESLITAIRTAGLEGWVAAQMTSTGSSYTSGGSDAVHKHTSQTSFCSLPGNGGDYCWRDWNSTQPLLWDFYRNATQKPDQLRQRVAFALGQILVVNNLEVDGTYGFRYYHNTLLQNAFGNYRNVLKKVAKSPLMGDFLNNANNDKAAPNENFGRELLQLFSIGTCKLNLDGTLVGNTCSATYDNETVRNYAYALTGWTYPAGGATPWGCWPQGANCRFYSGDMVPLAKFHDTAPRQLLSGVSLAADQAAPQALEVVLNSLVAHPNMAPFIGKQLIQHLVSSNPSPEYVKRVATAFNAGRYSTATRVFGAGQRGDLAATVAAVLLDVEARAATPARSAGRLREPVLMFTGVLRALNGYSDGEPLGWWWGESLRQHVFRAPSVFNFYPPNYPVPGTALVGPAFGLHNANSGLERLNYLTYLLYWDGSGVNSTVPNALGTKVRLTSFESSATDASALVDRMSRLATGGPLPTAPRAAIVKAVESYTAANNANWQKERVKQAAYLVFASPYYQVLR